jgi:WD40 repeat protein
MTRTKAISLRSCALLVALIAFDSARAEDLPGPSETQHVHVRTLRRQRFPFDTHNVRVRTLGRRRFQIGLMPLNHIYSISFSPSGEHLASRGGHDRSVVIWSLENRRVESRLELPTRWGADEGSPTAPVDYSPDGETVAFTGKDGSAQIWEVKTGKVRSMLRGHKDQSPPMDQVWSLAFSPNGDVLASGHEDGVVRFWDVRTGIETEARLEHPQTVDSLSFSPDGRLLCSICGDEKVRIWSLPDGQSRTRLTHCVEGRSAAIDPTGQRIAVADRSDGVRIWDLKTSRIVMALTPPLEAVAAITYSPRGRMLAVAGYGESITLWNPLNGQRLGTIDLGEDLIDSLRFSHDGSMIAAGSSDELIYLLKLPADSDQVSR